MAGLHLPRTTAVLFPKKMEYVYFSVVNARGGVQDILKL